ncbi:Glycosyltransferase involved in cell wall bisynthesis [Marivirga sericea]|uniref:Glycosyltransferase involved in cell wall bisynthesis n=1 Tax=Marivirga sericea TaxID=1028 RepID=A0A1X7J744_9BACT|nr:glycosyltransferase [Marivirga sericea]SMG23446.1 Glycosyltransferase involved in cell wall bisynthesis [Marivirga sericea]
MSFKKYDKIIFFPSVYWSHNWERQHELIYRITASVQRKVLIMQPLGLINYSLWNIVGKIFIKLKERSTFENSENPKLNNMVFGQLNYIPFHFIKSIDLVNFFFLKMKLKIKRNTKVFYWFTYVNGFTIKLISKNSFSVIDLAARRQVMNLISKRAKETERIAVENANIVFVDNYNTYLDYKDLNNQIYYVPQGVGIEMFTKPEPIDYLIKFKKEGKKIVGYCGALHASINYELLRTVIQALPDYIFLFVGNIVDKKSSILTHFDNVLFLGRKDKRELVNYYHIFDVGLIPYELTPFTSGVFPTKLFEYAACEVPIISSALPDILQYEKPFLKIYKTSEEMINYIKDLSQKKVIFRKDLISFAQDNTWEKRFNFIQSKIDEVQ